MFLNVLKLRLNDSNVLKSCLNIAVIIGNFVDILDFDCLLKKQKRFICIQVSLQCAFLVVT